MASSAPAIVSLLLCLARSTFADGDGTGSASGGDLVCKNCQPLWQECPDDDEDCTSQGATAKSHQEAASFNGQGFLGYHLEQDTQIQNISLYYRTAKKSGLLLFAQEHSRYLAVEVHRGVLVVRGRLGNSPGAELRVQTQTDQFANNRWHKVQVNLARNLVLYTDGHLQQSLPLPSGHEATFGDLLWFGGVNRFRAANLSAHTKGHYFKGCMGEVHINQMRILELPGHVTGDWHPRIVEVQGSVRGCWQRFFQGGHHGPSISLLDRSAFVAFSAWQAHHGATIAMQFRTASDSCVLFYSTGNNKDGQQFLIVELNDGRLHLLVNNGDGQRELQGGAVLSDRQWHHLYVHIEQRSVQVNVDSRDPLVLGLDRDMDRTFALTEPFYLGGLPESMLSEAYQLGVKSVGGLGNLHGVGLLGCVRDVHVNGREENVQLPLKNERTAAGCKWAFSCLSNPCREEQVCVDKLNTYTCECGKFMFDCGSNTTDTLTTLTSTTRPARATTTALQLSVSIFTTVIPAMEGQDTKLSNATLVVIPRSPFSLQLPGGRLFGPGLGENGTLIRILITRPPAHGELTTRDHGGRLSAFDLDLLASDGLIYSHNGAEEAWDKFEVSVVTRKDTLAEGIWIKIRVTPINDVPVRVNNTVLTLALGSRRLVTNSILAYRDVDNTDQDIFFTVDVSSPNGQLERVNKPEAPLLRFRQSDIDNNNVVFSHLGDELATAVSLILSVSDGQSAPQQTRLSVVAFTGRIIIGANPGLGVRYKSAQQITGDNMTAFTSFDAQQPKPPVTYNIVREPQTGHVARLTDNAQLTKVTVFTQGDVNASRVFLVHNSSSARAEDSLTVQLSSGFFTPSQEYTFAISVALPKPSIFPKIVVSTIPIVVKEGDSAFVTEEHIRVNLQPPTGQYGPLEIVLDKPFTYGRLILIQKNKPTRREVFHVNQLGSSLSYVHDNEESNFDNVSFCVRATGMWPPEVKVPIESCSHVLSVRVLPVNDQKPKLVKSRQLTLPEGSRRHITARHLLAKDEDTPASDLTFTITANATNGYVVLLPNKTQSTNTFTQEYVNANLVMFQHIRGTPMDSSFSYKLSDGVFSKAQIFVVKAQPVEIYVYQEMQFPLQVSAMTGQPVGMATMTLAQLRVDTDDPEQNRDIVFDVLQPAHHGTLVNTATTTSIRVFSYQQVRDGRIHYMLMLLDTTSQTDRLRLRARLGRSVHEGIFVDVVIHRKPLVNVNVVKDILTPHGQPVNLTEEILSVTFTGNITAEDVLIVIVEGPTQGQLQHWSGIGKMINKFSLAELKESLIFYQPATSAATADSVRFYVTNGYRNTSLQNVQIRTYLDHLLVISIGLNTTEGSTDAVLLPNSLYVEAPPNHNVVFSITKNMQHGYLTTRSNTIADQFSLADLQKRKIRYVHDGSETSNDSFSFSARTWPGSNITIPPVWQVVNGTFMIHVDPVNDHKPSRVSVDHQVSVVQFGHVGLTTAHLLYNDNDHHFNSSLLKYTIITHLQYGRLAFSSSPLTPVKEFYQNDVTTGRLRYYSLGDSEGSDFMEFRVEDEDPASHGVGYMIFVVEPLSVRIASRVVVLDEGGDTLLDTSSLVLTTNLNNLVKSILLLTVVKLPWNGVLLLNNRTVTTSDTIDWAQIQASSLVYHHGGSDNVTDSMSLRPTYYQLSFPVVNINFKIRPVDDTLPEFSQRQQFIVDEGDDTVLTNQHLAANDTEASDVHLRFILVRQPQHGHLLVNGRKMQVFTQKDINEQRVVYSHRGDAALLDSFVFNLTDGRNTISNKPFDIVVVPSEVPLLTKSFAVDEGAEVLLNTSILHVNNSFMAKQPVQFSLNMPPEHGKIYRGSEVVSNFSIQELMQRELRYTHDGSETLSDHMVVIAHLGKKQSLPKAVNITVHPVNDQRPVKKTDKTPLAVWVGEAHAVTRDILEWVDNDTSPENVLYKVQKSGENTGGWHLAMKHRPGVAIKHFSQADINSGHIVFIANGNEMSDVSVIYAVSDGVGSGVFSVMDFTVKQLRLEVRRNSGVWVLANTSTPLLKSNLSIVSNDNSGHQRLVWFRVDSHRHMLRHGHLALDGDNSSAINQFTNRQLERGRVLYMHRDTHTWAPRDHIRLTVTTANAASRIKLKVTVHIIHPTSPHSHLHSNSPLTVKENEQAVVTADNLQAGNIQAQLAHDFSKDIESVLILYTVQVGPMHGVLVDKSTSTSGISEFTQKEINSKQVVYVHDGSESLRDRVTLDVSLIDKTANKSLFSLTEQLAVIIQPVNDEPPIVAARPFLVGTQGLETVLSVAVFNTSDKDTEDSQLTFTVREPPAEGMFKVDNASVMNFTLLDVRTGDVLFHAGDTPGNYSTKLLVSDGVHSSLSNLAVQINEQQLVLTAYTLRLKQGDPAGLLDGGMWLQTNSPSDELLFNVTVTPQHGILRTLSEGNISEFTMAELEEGLFYEQVSSQSRDRFSLTASNRFKQHASVDVDIVVDADVKIPQTKKLFDKNEKMVIGPDLLDASTLAIKTNSNPIFTVLEHPNHGSLVVDHPPGKRKRRATKSAKMFTNADIQNRLVSYEPSNDAPSGFFTDGFEFELSAKSVSPGIGRLEFSVESPSTTLTSSTSVRLSVATQAPSKATNVPSTFKAPIKDSKNDLLMQVIVPASAGGLFLFLLIIIVIIKCRGSSEHRKQLMSQSSAGGRSASGREVPRNNSPVMASHGRNGAMYTDGAFINGRHRTAAPSGLRDKDIVQVTSSTFEVSRDRSRRSLTLPRNWNSEANPVLVRSTSDQNTAEILEVRSQTPPPIFSGDAFAISTLPRNFNKQLTPVHREVTYIMAGSHHSVGQTPTRTSNPAIISPESAPVLDKSSIHSSLSHTGRSGNTALRKQEFWI